VRQVLDDWTHPRWPGRTYNKPVHPAAQINQIGGAAGRDRISAVVAHIGD